MNFKWADVSNRYLLYHSSYYLNFDYLIKKSNDIKLKERYSLSIKKDIYNEPIFSLLEDFYSDQHISNYIMDWSLITDILTAGFKNNIFLYYNGETKIINLQNDISCLSFLENINRYENLNDRDYLVNKNNNDKNLLIVGNNRGEIGAVDILNSSYHFINEKYNYSPVTDIAPYLKQDFFFSKANSIYYLDMRKNEVDKIDTFYHYQIQSLNFSPDMKYLISSGKDEKKIAFWDVRNFNKPVTIIDGYLTSPSWVYKDGKYKILSSMDSNLFCIDISSPEFKLDFKLDFGREILSSCWLRKSNKLIISLLDDNYPVIITTYPNKSIIKLKKEKKENIPKWATGTEYILSEYKPAKETDYLSEFLKKSIGGILGKDEIENEIDDDNELNILKNDSNNNNNDILQIEKIMNIPAYAYSIKPNFYENDIAFYQQRGSILGLEIYNIFEKDESVSSIKRKRENDYDSYKKMKN